MKRPPWPWLVAGVIAFAGIARMWWWIRTGTHVQYSDYWLFLDRMYDEDGGLRATAFWRFHTDHLLTIPIGIYALNVALFGGSNITLGYFVLGCVIATIGLIWRWLTAIRTMSTLVRAVLGAFVALTLVAPHGAWNFLHAMSGSAWLVSNLLAVSTIHLATRNRTAWAVMTAALATITYGTGVMVWPVLALAVVAQRKPLREIVAVAAAAAVGMGSYFVYRARSVEPVFQPAGLLDLLDNVRTFLGSTFATSGGRSTTVGTLLLLGFVVSACLALVRRSQEALPFVLLGTFGLLNAAQIAYGRNFVALVGWGGGFQSSRYASIPALSAIVAVVLVTWAITADRPALWRRSARPAAALGVAGLAALVSWVHLDDVPAVRRFETLADRLTDAQRVQVSYANEWFPFFEQPDLDERLERLGHHPFDGRYHRDCGLLGDPFTEPLEEAGVTAQRVSLDLLPRGVEVQSPTPVGEDEIDCVVVIDDTGVVVGAGGRVGPSDIPVPDIIAYAPMDAGLVTLVVHSDDRWIGVPISSPVDEDAAG